MKSVSEKNKSIMLEDIQILAPSLLRAKFRMFGIKTVGDVLLLRPSQFAKKRSVGVRAITQYDEYRKLVVEGAKTDFKNMIIQSTEDEIQSIPEVRSRNGSLRFDHLPKELAGNKTLIDAFVSLESEFYAINRKRGGGVSRNYEMMHRYHGIDCRSHNLSEIALYHNLSRARVQQIIEMQYAIIAKILHGNQLHGMQVRCHPELEKMIVDFETKLLKHNVVSRDRAYRLATNDYGCTNNSMDKHLAILLKVFGYEEMRYRGSIIFYKKRIIRQVSLKTELDEILNIAQRQYKPMEYFTIIVELKKVHKKLSLNVEDLQYLLKDLAQFVEVDVEGKVLLQVRFEHVRTVGMMGLRVLYEENRPMSHSEMVRIINRELVKNGGKRNISLQSLKVLLSKTGEAIPLGKRGKWALKEWDMDNASIRVLIEQALRAEGSAISLTKLYDRIYYDHTDVKYSSFTKICRLYPSVFRITNRKYVELAEWDRSGIVEDRPNANVDHLMVMQEILRVFHESGIQRIGKKELWEILSRKGYRFNRATYYRSIKSYAIFKPHHRSNFVELSESPKVEFMKYSPITINNKSQKVKEQLNMWLYDQSVEYALEELSEKISSTTGCQKQVVYRVVRESKEFSTSRKGKKKYVRRIGASEH